MSDKRFNLLYEPWIAIVNDKGCADKVSLIEIFKQAHKIRMLSGDLPTQDIAILRLLLAILYAVFLRKDVTDNPAEIMDENEALERWSSIWNLGCFPSDIIENYLEDYKERFYLVHPERPFYQIPFDVGTEYNTAKLIGDISESGNRSRLFSSRDGDAKKRIGFAEAARWLIYVNAYDDASAKPKTKGLPSTGVGWLGKLGLIYAHGNTIFDTLMMNFITWDLKRNEPFGSGKACWELDKPHSGERCSVETPNSPLDMLTFQSRRLLLMSDNDGISGYKLLGGDVFPVENAFIEQMTIWKPNKAGSNVFVPQRHDPAKALWRSFGPLAAQGGGTKRPGIVDWISELQEEGVFKEKMVTFQTAGIKYDSKNSSVEDAFNDCISINARLLMNVGKIWITRIIGAIEITEKCVGIFGRFAIDLAKAGGNKEENSHRGISENAREDVFFKLDLSFRNWLSSIDPDKDNIDHRINEWLKTVENILNDCGKKRMTEAGEKAFVGKSTKENAFVAFVRFSQDIKKNTGVNK